MAYLPRQLAQRPTGWVRVSRGSHSGHVPYRERARTAGAAEGRSRARYVPAARRVRGAVPLIPGRDLDERTTTGEGIRLVPLETLDRRRYVPLDPGVKPPWRKRAYTDPEADES